MRFMVLVRGDEKTEAGVLPTTEELAAMGEFNEKAVEAGIMLAGEGLQPSSKGARITFSEGKSSVTDGPFPEAKELVAGFWLVQLDSLDQAIEWARSAPFQEGRLEIRQVFEADDFGEALTPELREQGDRLRAQVEARQK